MSRAKFKKLTFSVAALATAFGAGAPAIAGGGGYANFGYSSGYHGGSYYAAGHRGHRGHRGHHRRHHGHGGGGKGAAIALGVIGGAILLSEAARADERRRYADDRYYRDRYERRRYDERYDRDYEDRDYLPQRDYEEDRGDDLDRRLEGGADYERDAPADGGPEPISITYRAAYDACTNHARKALSNRGFVLAAPSRPETAEDTGGAWRITATVQAQNQRGESWQRAMYCEANESRVYLLELI